MISLMGGDIWGKRPCFVSSDHEKGGWGLSEDALELYQTNG